MRFSLSFIAIGFALFLSPHAEACKYKTPTKISGVFETTCNSFHITACSGNNSGCHTIQGFAGVAPNGCFCAAAGSYANSPAPQAVYSEDSGQTADGSEQNFELIAEFADDEVVQTEAPTMSLAAPTKLSPALR